MCVAGHLGVHPAVWEPGRITHIIGPMGMPLPVASTLGWTPCEGWWCWDVPVQVDLLPFVREHLKQVLHRVCESLRCHSSRQLEAHRPVNFGGLGDGAAAAPAALAARQCEWLPQSWRGPS